MTGHQDLSCILHPDGTLFTMIDTGVGTGGVVSTITNLPCVTNTAI